MRGSRLATFPRFKRRLMVRIKNDEVRQLELDTAKADEKLIRAGYTELCASGWQIRHQTNRAMQKRYDYFLQLDDIVQAAETEPSAVAFTRLIETEAQLRGDLEYMGLPVSHYREKFFAPAA